MNTKLKDYLLWWVIAIFAVVLIVFIEKSEAADDAGAVDYYISGVSWHEYGDFNEVNGGYGIRYNDTAVPVVVGTFLNSESTQSVYAGFEFGYAVYPWLSAGVDVLVVSGYQRGPFVAPVPYVEVWRIKTTIIPPTKTSPLTLGLQVRY